MKQPRPALLITIVLTAGLAVFVLVGVIADKYLTKEQAATACPSNRPNHAVLIQYNSLDPSSLIASRCDTLTITNMDGKTRLIGFGKHDHHQAYNGIVQQFVARNESLTVTLNKTGTYLYHDHFDDEVSGSFTVTD